MLSSRPTYRTAWTRRIFPESDDRLGIGGDSAGAAAMVAEWMAERKVASLRGPHKAFRICASPGESHGHASVAAYPVAATPAVANFRAAIVWMAQIDQAIRVPDVGAGETTL